MKLQALNINGSSKVWFYLLAVMESVLVKIQNFTINDSDGFCDRGCFCPYAVVVCF